MKMEAKVGVVLSQTKECLESPEAGRDRKDSHLEPLDGAGALLTF